MRAGLATFGLKLPSSKSIKIYTIRLLSATNSWPFPSPEYGSVKE